VPPLILAADTSTAVSTVALCHGPQLLVEATVNAQRLHAERLLSTVDWVLREAGYDVHAVDAFAVTIGPGSFTGLRIGAATFKGLAFAAVRPLVPVPTLDALASTAAPREGTVLALIDARMREVYGAAYEFRAGARTRCAEDRVGPVELMTEGLSGPVYCVGDGAVLYRDRILAVLPEAQFAPPALNVPRGAAVAAEAALQLAAGKGVDPADAAWVEPVYLRASQPEMMRAAKATGA